jgi:hypothetical protein
VSTASATAAVWAKTTLDVAEATALFMLKASVESVAGAGTVQGDATALSVGDYVIHVITSGASNAGVRLSAAVTGKIHIIFNTTANTMAGSATKILASGRIIWPSSKTLDISNGTFDGIIETKDATTITATALSSFIESRRPNGVADTGFNHRNLLLSDGAYTFAPGLARPGFASGRYYGGLKTNSLATFALSANVLYCSAQPLYIGKRQAFTGIGIWPTVAGRTVNARFGIYKADGTGRIPSTLVLNAGAMVLTAAAQIDVATTQTLEQGWYWLAMVVDAACTVNAIGSSDASGFFTGWGSGNVESPRITKSHTYGALPSPFGAVTYTDTSSAPHLLLKV